MDTTLTTITPYWGRPASLKVWLRAIIGATVPGVEHLLICVGQLPEGDIDTYHPHIRVVTAPEAPAEKSIGHYHNLGAGMSESEWMMKLDIDAIPNTQYFSALLNVLDAAQPREWFDGGMVFLTREASAKFLTADNMPLSGDVYEDIMRHRTAYSDRANAMPIATNFICRRKEYLDLGGCCEEFRGKYWQDYQQIYMLERNWLREDPLPGEVTWENVTKRCCREIERKKTVELWRSNPWLALLHRWHPPTRSGGYRTHNKENRKVLLDYILKCKKEDTAS